MCDIDFDDYEISEHRHVFAAWAAARASSTSPNCRYEVWIAKVLLDNLGFGSDLLCPDDLPSKDELDDKHRAWRKKMVEDAGPLIEKVYAEKVEAAREKAAKEKKKFTKPKKPVFTHGVAAKLLNVYVKSVFVCGFGDVHERAGAFHPPIDKLLLDMLIEKDKNAKRLKRWRKLNKRGWSNFESKEYEDAIGLVRQLMAERGQSENDLWKIERLWPGHQ
jgi:hypothetical protein